MGLRTKSLITKESDIDTVWAFEFYLNLGFSLTGGDHKVKSPFSIDKDPSFSVYRPKTDASGRYRFNDLSTGVKGSIIDLVAILKSPDPNKPLSWKEAFEIIKKDFENYKNNNTSYRPGVEKQLINTKGRVTDYELRKWTQADYQWWKQWGISRERLEEYNVSPMGSWKMHKIVDGVEKNMNFNNPLAFGYLSNKGELAKIYQPGMAGAKFIKVMDYFLQGFDQLKFDVSDLLIMSSLKDGMSFLDMFIEGYEFVAPDSENVPVRKQDLEFLRTKYKRIRLLFDDDAAGKKAVAKYKAETGLDNVELKLSKDVADSVRDLNGSFVKTILLTIL